MKFYIASKLDNYIQVQALARKLKEAGWVHTYDWTRAWTEYGCVRELDEEILKNIAEQEVKGVSESDIVIVLTPQGRGTHTEFGMAIALNKIVFLCHTDDTYFKCGGNTSSFYFHPNVIRLVGNMEEIAEAVLNYGIHTLP